MKISDLIAEFLEKLEIKIAFGIIGSANSYIFNSISERGYTKIICNHQEQSAVMCSNAYNRLSKTLSCVLVTAAAGSSNAITGVISSYGDSIPTIIISGQEKSEYVKNHKNNRLQGIQGYNSSKVAETFTKYSITIMSPNEVQNELEKAYRIAMSDRPGPVWIDIPQDIQSKEIEPRGWDLSIYSPKELCINDFMNVTELLCYSERPLILAGHGIKLSSAKEEFKELVKKLKMPTILSWSGIDLLEEEDPYYFGRAGIYGQRRANFIVQNSDLIILLGTRLSLLQSGYDISKFAPKAKIILVDIDQTEYNKNKDRYTAFVNCDCKNFINELKSYINYKNFERPEWLKYCINIRNKYPLLEECHQKESKYINSYEFIDELNSYLKEDHLIITDMGTALLSGFYGIKIKKNQSMFTSLGLGEMGYGLPGAIGATFACPNQPILCLNNDGSMMMNLQELQTIIHHNLPIKIIIFENDGYLMIKHTQNMLFNGSRVAVNKESGVSCPDFIKIGDAFGFNTFEVKENNKNIYTHFLKEFLNSKGPSILVVHMDPEQDFVPKVKGVIQNNGSISSPSLEEMSPLLKLEEIKEAMVFGFNEQSNNIKRS